jgi:hypothetical protein
MSFEDQIAPQEVPTSSAGGEKGVFSAIHQEGWAALIGAGENALAGGKSAFDKPTFSQEKAFNDASFVVNESSDKKSFFDFNQAGNIYKTGYSADAAQVADKKLALV